MAEGATILLALLAAQAPADAPASPAATVYAAYRVKTEAAIRCKAAREGDDILVCGRRDADLYRVPLIVADAGDPRREGVSAERTRLQAETTPCQDRGPFLIECGMVGMTIGTRNGLVLGGERPLAP